MIDYPHTPAPHCSPHPPPSAPDPPPHSHPYLQRIAHRHWCPGRTCMVPTPYRARCRITTTCVSCTMGYGTMGPRCASEPAPMPQNPQNPARTPKPYPYPITYLFPAQGCYDSRTRGRQAAWLLCLPCCGAVGQWLSCLGHANACWVAVGGEKGITWV